VTATLLTAGPSPATVTVISATVGAVVSLLVAIGTQVVLSVRDSNARRYSRRRAALTDAQDAALAMRGRLGEYGMLSRANLGRSTPELAAAERHYVDARALLEVTLSRVDDQRVVAATLAWREAAEVSFISSAEVSAGTEQDRWQRLNTAIGSALQSRDGVAR